MKLAINQPYFFPYLGYWQLMKAADTFVVYDDVSYITRGWINRNRVLVNGEPKYITVPLVGASQNRTIREHRLAASDPWRPKLLRMLEVAYRRRPFFDETFALVESIVANPTEDLAELLVCGLELTKRHLNIDTRIVPSSTVYLNAEMRGRDRILDICRQEGARTYVNAKGGMDLYEDGVFNEQGIELLFVDPSLQPYEQGSTTFVPALSIIDALMCLGRGGVQPHLGRYTLIRKRGCEDNGPDGLEGQAPA